MKKEKTIIGSAIMVMIVVLGSKVLGFLRQMVIATVYGSNINTDIYFISSDFMIAVSGALLASLTTALVTIYIDIKIKQSREEANAVTSKMLMLFLMAGGVFILLINILAPYIARILAPMHDARSLAELTSYLRFFSIAFIFTAFQSIYAAVLNADNSFVPGKLYGILYNPIAIFLVILLDGRFGIKTLMAAYVLGNIAYTLALKFCSRKTFKFKPSLNFSDNNVKHLVFLTLPVLFSNLSVQLNGMVDKAICSLLGEGFASNYSYAYTLEQFITATVTATLSLILLSRYATYASQGNTKMLIKTFRNSLCTLIILLAPIMVITCATSYDIVSIVYLRGEFDTFAALHTSYALAGFAVGFALIAIREMYIRLSFSYQNTKIPMFANLASVALNIVLSYLLSRKLGILGVTLATSLSTILTIIILNKAVKRYIPDFKFTSMIKLIVKVLAASFVAYVTAVVLRNNLEINTLIRFGICTVCSAIIYLAALWALKCSELYELANNARLQIMDKFKK